MIARDVDALLHGADAGKEAEAETKIVGTHEFQFVPPDEIRFVLRGVLNDDDTRSYLDFLFAQGDKAGRKLYSAYDLSAWERVSEESRKLVINVERPYPYAALAIVGASFSTRALASMILRAGGLVAPKKFGFPWKFVASMAEAHAWFEELRARDGDAK